jgi:hypothetical protein
VDGKSVIVIGGSSGIGGPLTRFRQLSGIHQGGIQRFETQGPTSSGPWAPLKTIPLIKARVAQDNATATKLTDAEPVLRRAQQDQFDASYDYMSARTRLNSGMGSSALAQ